VALFVGHAIPPLAHAAITGSSGCRWSRSSGGRGWLHFCARTGTWRHPLQVLVYPPLGCRAKFVAAGAWRPHRRQVR